MPWHSPLRPLFVALLNIADALRACRTGDYPITRALDRKALPRPGAYPSAATRTVP